jgi:hypothetical protein
MSTADRCGAVASHSSIEGMWGSSIDGRAVTGLRRYIRSPVNGALFALLPMFAQPPDNNGRIALLRRGGCSGSSGATVNALAEFSLSLAHLSQ